MDPVGALPWSARQRPPAPPPTSLALGQARAATTMTCEGVPQIAVSAAPAPCARRIECLCKRPRLSPTLGADESDPRASECHRYDPHAELVWKAMAIVAVGGARTRSVANWLSRFVGARENYTVGVGRQRGAWSRPAHTTPTSRPHWGRRTKPMRTPAPAEFCRRRPRRSPAPVWCSPAQGTPGVPRSLASASKAARRGEGAPTFPRCRQLTATIPRCPVVAESTST